MPIEKVNEDFRSSSVLFLHSIFNIEKKCVLTILKTINLKTVNSEIRSLKTCEKTGFLSNLLPAHISSIVTEANHNGAVCLFRGSFQTQQIYEDWFSCDFDGLSYKN